MIKKAEKISDIDLVVAAKSGDQTAWSDLMYRHRGCIHSARIYAKRIGRDEDDAISHINEAFVKVVNKFDPDRKWKFITYLWPSLMSAAVRADRVGAIRVVGRSVKGQANNDAAMKAMTAMSINDDGDGRHVPMAELLIDQRRDRVGVTREELSSLADIMMKLDQRHREALLMRLQGLKLREIGAYLNVTRERARQLINHATAFVKRRLST